MWMILYENRIKKNDPGIVRLASPARRVLLQAGWCRRKLTLLTALRDIMRQKKFPLVSLLYSASREQSHYTAQFFYGIDVRKKACSNDQAFLHTPNNIPSCITRRTKYMWHIFM